MTTTDTLDHVTTSVARRVRQGYEADFVEWTDRGMDLVRTFPGFLGGGWLRSSGNSSDYHVLYRFETHDNLDGWLRSDARRAWLSTGRPIADDVATHRLSGVEGWFEPQSNLTDAVRVIGGPPPRWKQAISIGVAFYAVSLLVNIVVTPHLTDLNVALRTALVVMMCTPLMVYVVMPFVTARLRRWLVPRS
ncbi:antibiotic biosynthesis monooxygenase [Rhodococcus sp. SBT000017]|uniref:antibiotic biosynthesis monooxygenase n=1 Tax=unclassified Rhodococcus (in: high G+C Gram-positive bacteria) TaxID=192944 RepID=UPI000B21DCAA|nr:MULTISPECIES: antibiotic biosynthesis monooxygenase [unclassified Rhodococcus (in: high G+C Gram-positive bacteria)]RMB76585.1 antibiotic biosynthesis monooxygenase [Rhodococcus sp. SBT000017]